MTKRKTLSIIAGTLMAGALLYFAVWPFVGGGTMQAFCRSLVQGTLTSGVSAAVRHARYRMSPTDKQGLAFIHDPRSYGRFICEVQFREDRLVSAQYQQND